MSVEIPRVIGLRQGRPGPLGLLCAGSLERDGREIRVRFLVRDLTDEELERLVWDCDRYRTLDPRSADED